jgi:hypothetical protein
MSHLFISYKREDMLYRNQLIEYLKIRNIPFWADLEIEAGLGWREEIDNALADAFALALILSPKTILSHYITYEWSWAIGHDIPVIPLMFEDITVSSLHAKLSSLQIYRCVDNIPDELTTTIQRHQKPTRLASFVNGKIVAALVVPCTLLYMLDLLCDSPLINEQDIGEMLDTIQKELDRTNRYTLPSTWLNYAHSFTPFQKSLFNDLCDKLDNLGEFETYVWWQVPQAGLSEIKKYWQSIEASFLYFVDNSYLKAIRKLWEDAQSARQEGYGESLAYALGDLFTFVMGYSEERDAEITEMYTQKHMWKRSESFFKIGEKVTGKSIGLG